ncbi:hypothetical protein BDQ17DRAFT_1311941 [Cyathus striatus]|nr:hypothetical protein BDQ17DRAFT_1311941 [Cyathus striatus]
MVANTTSDLYSPFQQPMIHEEPQSSEEGSGLHSPVFTAPYPSPQADSFRYQPDPIDVQHAAGNFAQPHYDYTHSLNIQQQPPILDTRLELPSPGARQVTFPTQPFALSPRNQLGLDFPVSVNPRIPSTVHTGGPIDYRYNPASERRLPGGPSHDPTYPRHSANSTATLLMEADHRPPPATPTEHAEPSATGTASTSRESRKEISSVVIACRQCRGRKIRCDSTRPQCNNCVRRSNPCEYDLVPKRRGPDKRPGTRQRSCKKRPLDGSVPPPPPKRKRTNPSETRESAPSRVKENMVNDPRSPNQSRHPDRTQDAAPPPHPSSQPLAPPNDLRISTDPSQDVSQTYRRQTTYGYESSFPRPLDVNTLQTPITPQHRMFPTPSSPILRSKQKEWWDKILSQYHTYHDIVTNIQFLIDNTAPLLYFINVDFLSTRLSNETERLQIQPAFIFAALALAQLMRSSSTEQGPQGVRRAIQLRNQAEIAYRDAVQHGWLDASLAEAALILALFESSSYPEHTFQRAATALYKLDEVIYNMQLTANDDRDPEVSRFAPDSVPIVDTGVDIPYNAHDEQAGGSPGDPHNNRHYLLPWDRNWTSEEVRDEEIRRLCWSALSLASSYSAQCAAFNKRPPKLNLNDPSKYVLLFPGEVLDRASLNYRSADSLSPKESVWALYCRAMLLWNFCCRFREDSLQYEEKAEHAHEAYVEAQMIQDALELHKCNLDTTLIYMTREYIYNTRLLVTQALRRFVFLKSGPTTTPGPIFKRQQAEEWLYYQHQVIARVTEVIHHLEPPESHQLTRRPFRVTWFMNQLAICLILWKHDNTLTDALQLGKGILPAIDVMNALWPCDANRNESELLRRELTNACITMRTDIPLSPKFTIPGHLLHNL